MRRRSPGCRSPLVGSTDDGQVGTALGIGSLEGTKFLRSPVKGFTAGLVAADYARDNQLRDLGGEPVQREPGEYPSLDDREHPALAVAFSIVGRHLWRIGGNEPRADCGNSPGATSSMSTAWPVRASTGSANSSPGSSNRAGDPAQPLRVYRECLALAEKRAGPIHAGRSTTHS
jgi:hypothetical protein